MVLPILFIVLSVVQQSNIDSIRDQVIVNTQRLSSIERTLGTIQNTASSTDQALSIQVNSNQLRIQIIETRVQELSQHFNNVLIYLFMQTAAVATFGIRYWMASNERKRQQQ